MSNLRNAVRLTVIGSLLTTIGLAGCASNLTEDERIDREYAATERKQQIREFIDSCEAANYVVMYTGPSTQKLRDPVKRIPGHARKSDYVCGSSNDAERMQAEVGLR